MVGTGDQVQLGDEGCPATVGRLLGEGSQGIVFAAAAEAGRELALKWYFAASATAAQRDALIELIDRGAPSDRFLWPSELAFSLADQGFGYTMPLRPTHYVGLADLLTGRVDVSFSSVCRLCLELADSFLELHSQGLCYRDISFSNVFFDPSTGVPLICDNDNVGIDGATPASGVLGTRRFMAPEIVRGEAMPSTRTDLYSLSVLLFYVLCMGHPLVGRRELDFECWDASAESVLFGSEPVFVFDPLDSSNELLPDLHVTTLRYWSLYPTFIRELFCTAFTAGLTDPAGGRVRESVWRSAMARLFDVLVRCDGCSKENFFDATPPGPVCWNCGRMLTAPVFIRIGSSQIALASGKMLYRHHLLRDYDFDNPVGEIGTHPRHPNVLGLKNLSARPWSATSATGEHHQVDPGRSVRLAPDLSIDFGAVTAVVSSAPSG